MLLAMLPLLEGWSYKWITRSGKVRVGEGTKEIDKVEGRGFFLYSSAVLEGSLDAKYCNVIGEIDGPGKPFLLVENAEYMRYSGFVNPVPFGVMLTRYSDSDKVYKGVATLNEPIPFVRRVRLLVQPPRAPIEEPGVTEIKYDVSVGIVLIEDVELFRDSVRRVLGTRALPDLKALVG